MLKMNKNLLVGLIFFMVLTTLFFMRRTQTISKRHFINELSELSNELIRDKLQIDTVEQARRRESGLEDKLYASRDTKTDLRESLNKAAERNQNEFGVPLGTDQYNNIDEIDSRSNENPFNVDVDEVKIQNSANTRDGLDKFEDKIEEQVDKVEEIDRTEEDLYTEQELTEEKMDVNLSRSSRNSENLWLNVLDNPNLPDNGNVFESAKERLEYRRSWLRSMCHIMRRQGFTPPNMKMYENQYKSHFIVNHEKKILYCYLPKVANTNFRRVFLGLQGVVPKNRIPYISGYNVYFVHDDKFIYLNEFTDKEQHTMLNTYQKFMVVRDPFERLLSGYRNKFFHPNPEHTAEFHRKVSSFYRIRPNLLKREGIKVRTANFKEKPLTFEEFLVYFIDTYEVGAFMNEHFTASNQLCDPCKTKIEYIAKYDTLFDDVQHIFDTLNIDIEFPGRNDNYYAKETRNIERVYYEKIPKWLLMKVWHILKYDYVLFGFSLPEWFRDRMKE